MQTPKHNCRAVAFTTEESCLADVSTALRKARKEEERGSATLPRCEGSYEALAAAPAHQTLSSLPIHRRRSAFGCSLPARPVNSATEMPTNAADLAKKSSTPKPPSGDIVIPIRGSGVCRAFLNDLRTYRGEKKGSFCSPFHLEGEDDLVCR